MPLAQPSNLPGPMGAPGQAPADPLAQLRDIHLPQEAITNLPIAPGWWILAALVIAALVTGVLMWRSAKKRNRYRREALLLCDAIIAGQHSTQEFIRQINTLLKRCALAAYPTHSIVSAFGEDWINWLQQTAPSVAADEDLKNYWLNGSYRAPLPVGEDQAQQQQLLKYARAWIEKHLSEKAFSKRSQKNPIEGASPC